LAVHALLDRKPDLVVSGINHGSNASVNVIYSGTMSAAVEGAMQGIPSIGFSLLDYRWDASFEACLPFVEQIAREALNGGVPAGTCLNVNFPKPEKAPYAGIKVCRQAQAKWVEEFDKREDPRGKTYYWLTGTFINEDHGQDTDEWALANGFVSVVPVSYDLTAYASLGAWHNRLEP
jgi:5'-nucleotidase